MAVTVTVFAAAGLKRGDPIYTAAFALSFPIAKSEGGGRMGAGWPKPVAQNGNVYVLELFSPLGPTEAHLSVYDHYPYQEGPKARAAGVQVRQGEAVEVWV
jgi:hypothetical protein